MENYLPIVREALRTKAPNLFKSLQKSGHLDAFVKTRASQIHESVGQSRSKLISQRKALSITNHMQKVQSLTEIDHLAQESALHDLLQFPEETTTE